MDEKIVAMQSEIERSKVPDLKGNVPVRIGERYYEFVEESFFEQKITMWIPKDFTDMPLQMSKLKYPYEQRPQIIKTDETGATNITLSQIDQDMQDDEEWVKELTDGMKGMIKRANPSHVFYTDGLEEVNGKPVGYFNFKSAALDGYIYHVMFFFALEGKIMMGTFSCIYQDYTDWHDVALQMIRTIDTMPVEEGGER